MFRPIKKAVFPVAGLGTRFMPATKAIPKEMLTIVDRPVIQMAVDEAREAGIEQFVFVTGRNKSAIEDHFDKQYELESTLRQRGKLDYLNLLEKDLPGRGEIQLTDALIALMEEQDFWGFKFEGETYDCGDRLGFLLANVAYGLDREDIGPAFRGSLARLLLRSERSPQGDYSAPALLSTVPDRHSGERTAA